MQTAPLSIAVLMTKYVTDGFFYYHRLGGCAHFGAKKEGIKMAEELNNQSSTQGNVTVVKEGEDTNSADGSAEQKPEKVFSQEDVDRIAGKTRQEAINKYAKDLGLGSAADLEAAIKANQEAQEASKTELEKAVEARAQAEQRADDALKNANDKLIRAAFLAEAGKLGAQHPEDAYLLADLSKVEITDDGQVAGVSEAVAAIVEGGRLVISGKPLPPKLDGGAGNGERPAGQAVKLTQAQIDQAKKMKISLEDYAANIKQK